MAYSLDVSQQKLIDTLKSEFSQESFEVAIPEPETVMRDAAGHVKPYLTFQFGDISDGFSETFGGAATGDYWLPFYVQAVSSDAAVARKIGNKLIRVFLSLNTPYGGEVRKRFGGRVFPIGNMDGTVAAYVFPISLGAKVQLFDDV